MSITNEQHHIILQPLNLYPSLSSDSIEMIEQVMNGVLLVSSQNLQEAIKRVVTLEATCHSMLSHNTSYIIEAIQPLCANYGAPIVDSVRANHYITHCYNNRLKHFNVSKLDDINHEFLALKKIEYNGDKIKYLPTFIDWVYQMAHQQHTFLQHTPNDELMNDYLFPELSGHFQMVMETIETQTKRYANKVRKDLFRQKRDAS